MGGYIGASAGGVANAAERKQTYTITTATTSLTGLAYTPTKVHVFHNGVRLVDGTDYTATNGTSITLTNAAQNGDEVVVISYPSFQTSDTVSAANGGTFAGNVTISNDLLFEGAIGADGCIKKNNTTNRDEMQIYSGSDAYSTGSKGAGIHLYGNSDTQHDGDMAFLTGPNDNGNARLIISGHEDKARITMGNSTVSKSIWDYVDENLDPAVLNIKSPSGQPALLIEGASGSEGDIVTPDGEAIQIGHWNKTTSAFTERMRINSSGIVTMPDQPCFNASLSSNQNNIAVNSTVTILFANERFDVGSNFSSNTFTAPATGKYQLNVELRLDSVDTGATYYHIYLITSNKTYHTIMDPNFSSDLAYHSMSLAVLADMDANDTVYVALYQANGSAQTDISQDSTFSGVLVA